MNAGHLKKQQQQQQSGGSGATPRLAQAPHTIIMYFKKKKIVRSVKRIAWGKKKTHSHTHLAESTSNSGNGGPPILNPGSPLQIHSAAYFGSCM